MPEKTDSLTLKILSFLSLALLAMTIWVLVDSEKALTNCVNNVPVENCNRPAGDFAIEIDTTTNDILGGCGQFQNKKCIFFNIPTLSDAITKCLSLGNKCYRFIYEKNTMYVVSLVAQTTNSKGKHMYVRQNGVTYKGRGKSNKSYPKREVQGSETSVTNFSYNNSSMITSGFNTITSGGGSYFSGGSGSSGGGSGSSGGGGGY